MLPQTRSYRSRQAALRALLERELATLWPLLDPEAVDATFPTWARPVALAVGRNRQLSAIVGARYLRELGVAVNLAGPVPAEVLLRSLVVTGPVAIKSSMTAGKPLDLAAADAFTLSSQAAVRHMLDGGRETVRASSIADRRVKGWQRIAAGNACDFCQELAGRGAIYTEASAQFACHDACACGPEPVFT